MQEVHGEEIYFALKMKKKGADDENSVTALLDKRIREYAGGTFTLPVTLSVSFTGVNEQSFEARREGKIDVYRVTGHVHIYPYSRITRRELLRSIEKSINEALISDNRSVGQVYVQ